MALQWMPRPGCVSSPGMAFGVEDVDLAEAAARGIPVTRAPGSNSRAVAEHTLAMIPGAGEGSGGH